MAILQMMLTHCRLNDTIYWNANFDFRYVMLCDLDISREK